MTHILARTASPSRKDLKLPIERDIATAKAASVRSAPVRCSPDNVSDPNLRKHRFYRSAADSPLLLVGAYVEKGKGSCAMRGERSVAVLIGRIDFVNPQAFRRMRQEALLWNSRDAFCRLVSVKKG